MTDDIRCAYSCRHPAPKLDSLEYQLYNSGTRVIYWIDIPSPYSVPDNLEANDYATMSGPFKIAVLDDYQGFAEPIFQKLDSSKFQVVIFRDTLRPYNHPETAQDEKDKLVKRLEPFGIICERNTSPSPRPARDKAE